MPDQIISRKDNDLPAGFKMTELGPLPEEWQVLPIESFAETQTGGTPSRKNPEYFGDGYFWVKSGELNDCIIKNTNESITQEGLVKSNARLLPRGTLLLAMYGATVGKVGILGIEAATNQAICAIIPKKEIAISEFLFYAFMWRRNDLLKARYGGAQPNISQTIVRNYPIPLPPIHEQRAIAHVLRTVQQAREATERVIAALKELKKSLMRHLFTYGPVPVDQTDKVKLKETEIGLVPEHWEVVRLGEVTEINYGIQAAVANLHDKTDGIPILTNKNITNEGTLDISKLNYYKLPANKRSKLILRKGDLLFNWRSGSQKHVGKTALFDLDGEFTFSSFILCFRTSSKINNLFLLYYLHYIKSKSFFIQKRDQSSVNSVFNASSAANIPVVLPKIDVQNEISKLLKHLDSKIEMEENTKQALEALFQSLLQQLMTGKIRIS